MTRDRAAEPLWGGAGLMRWNKWSSIRASLRAESSPVGSKGQGCSHELINTREPLLICQGASAQLLGERGHKRLPHQALTPP